MYLVVVHNWKKEALEVARIIAETMGCLVYEAQQKIAAGGPAVLVNFADQAQAETLAAKLVQGGVPAFVIDPAGVRNNNLPFFVRSFELAEQSLCLESIAGKSCTIDFGIIELMLVAICSAGTVQTTDATTSRKFSLGKTLLAGGLPMTRKVQGEAIVTAGERDETLWLYARGQTPIVFDRAVIGYDGLGDAIQLTRDLNFSYLKTELRRLATKARYDDRLLQHAVLVRLLGPALNPDTDLDLAFEILACSLLDTRRSGATAS